MEHLTGYSINEVGGTNITKHIIPEDFPAVLASINRILASGKKESVEYRVKIKNGEIRHVISSSGIILKNGQPAGLTGVITDITQRKLAEEALRDAELKFRTIFDSASDGILLADPQNKNFISVNERICVMLGYTKEDFLKLNVSDIHPKESLPHVIDQFEKLFRKEISIAHDIPVMRKDKTVFFADVNCSSIILDGKECLIGMFRDTTRRRVFEEELRESEKKYKLLAEKMTDIVWIMDLNLRTIYVSPSIQNVLGFTQEERLRQTLDEQLTPDSLSIATEVLKDELALEEQGQADPQKTKTLILDFYHKDGSTRWLESTINGIRNEQGILTRLHGVSRDITERQHLEKSLKERDQVFRKLSANVPGMIYQFVRKPDGTYHLPFSTDAVKNIFGYSSQEVANDFSLITKSILPEDIDDFISSIEYSAQNMTEWKHEYRIQIPGSPVRWMLAQSTPEKMADGSIIWHGFNADITEQKEAQESLRISQENYKRLFEDHAAVKLIIDSETGSILDANHAAAKYYGWSRYEIKQMKIWHINTLSPKDVKQEMDKAIRQKKVHFEFCHRRADGSIRNVDVYSSKIRIDGKDVLHSIVHDITERKQLEEALLMTQFSIDHASYNMIWLDENANIVYANDAFISSVGYTREELLKLKIHDVDPDFTADKWIPHVNELKKCGSMNFESRHRKKDGQIFPVEVNCNYFEFKGRFYSCVFDKDITERKKAEEALRNSETKLRAVIQGSPVSQFVIDENHEIIYWNKALEEISGIKSTDVLGTNKQWQAFYSTERPCLADLVVDEKIDIIPEFYEGKYNPSKYMEGAYEAIDFFPIIGKEGKWLFFSAAPIRDAQGNIIGAVETLEDITERKNAEKELEKHRQHLEELVRERTIKLEASNTELEAFSYSASHDLRAPLRSIEGFSHALLEDYKDQLDTQGKDYLRRIKVATRRMADLIEDMLQLSRITRLGMNIEEVDLTSIARSVISDLQKSHPERNVQVKIAEGLEDKADLRLARIVLDNLLGNAWKFTEKQEKASIEFGLWKADNGKKVYFVRDNGAGFDMAYSDKLFAPFQRLHADDEFPGTGIGLATVRRIINRHGGKIWAESETGKGATFYFSVN